MRRILCFVLAVLMLLVFTCGCVKVQEKSGGSDQSSSRQEGGSASSSPDASDAGKSGSDSKSGSNDGAGKEVSSGAIYKEPGDELGDFYGYVNDTIGKFERAFNSYETDDFDLMAATADPMAVTMGILILSSLDYIESGDNPREEGKLNGADCVREKNGSKITFSSKRVRDEDGFDGVSKAGDIVTEAGSLDTAANAAIVEKTTERDGILLERSICEVVVLPDGTVIAQFLSKPMPPRDDRVKEKGNAYFARYNDKEFEIIKADFEPDPNFTYKSIIGNANATPESMSEGYVKVRRLTVKDDAASAEKY
jgi:hypothetical protein